MNQGAIAAGVRSNLVQEPPDVALLGSLRDFTILVSSVCEEYAFIGSVALQTFLPTFQRQPRDVDVLIPEREAERILDSAAASGLHVKDDVVASFVQDQTGLKLQLIPHRMRWIDRETREIFARPTLYFEDRVESREFVSLVTGERVQLRTPVLEYLIGMNLVQPLGSELYTLFSAVLSHQSLDLSVVEEFFERVGEFALIASDRLDRLLYLATQEESSTRSTWAAMRSLLADL